MEITVVVNFCTINKRYDQSVHSIQNLLHSLNYCLILLRSAELVISLV